MFITFVKEIEVYLFATKINAMLEKQNNKVAHKADYRGMLTEMFCDHGHTKNANNAKFRNY
jgi:hypothetical protein